MSPESIEIQLGFLKKNTIFITGLVNQDAYEAFFDHIHLLEIRGAKEIEIRISSQGGDCKPGFDMYDLIRAYPGEVTGVVYGKANSMAAVILQACDVRVMLKHATFLAHDVRRNPVTFSEMTHKKDSRKIIKKMTASQDQMVGIFLESSKRGSGQPGKFKDGMTRAQVRKMLRKNKTMSAVQARKRGLIDRVGREEES